MIWILVAVIGLIIVLVGVATYIKKEKEKRSKGAGFGEGLAVGMLMCAVIFIALSELGVIMMRILTGSHPVSQWVLS